MGYLSKALLTSAKSTSLKTLVITVQALVHFPKLES